MREGMNYLSSRTVDGCLTRQLLKHLGGSGQSITRLADRDVQDELVDSEFPHGVGALVVAFRHFDYVVVMYGVNECDRVVLCEGVGCRVEA